MEIKNVILHNLIKEEKSTKVELDDRKQENEINDFAVQLSKGINERFNSTGLNTGHFRKPEKDEQLTQFENLLETYYDDGFNDFVSFSKSAAAYLQKQLMGAAPAKGGHLWFNHYIHNGEHFLSVVLLREKVVMRIDKLELEQFDSVDLDKLHMAARINLTKWKNADELSNRYISFKIGKEAKKVTDYFANFIGCEEFTQAASDTKALVQCIGDYCRYHKFDDAKTELVKNKAHDQIIEWRKEEKQTIRLDTLSEIFDATFLSDDSEEYVKGHFLRISQGEPYNLNNELATDSNALRRLKKYSGKNQYISVSFDAKLLGHSVKYNPENGVLTISEIPKALKDQLDGKS
ncbi:nucleoid-associated protein [Vibrio cholerae]|uniref:nucleoid-associated protein n=1 Tax=Vibrio TaxID=662 RepID=UPI00137316C2|nr:MULTISPECIES: nucleoid-associated protein [Vibrio]MBL4265717.1 nucleoid-associated protein [Vibrio fluvialis]MBL4270123.1 nucleoid-associated protein [Vibrio fluvialis]NAR20233.1 nucleoid-associated protein NdpA [Vibrio cholerae]NAR31693.1 nucleoid-associated protein NdpA [Vibrio cholerae]